MYEGVAAPQSFSSQWIWRYLLLWCVLGEWSKSLGGAAELTGQRAVRTVGNDADWSPGAVMRRQECLFDEFQMGEYTGVD
ncbi:hypothetical protein LIA77_10793 [Sarocladium implicatum]|nr:hypothetical protein LIA77_10793 [Sarocladium implicatum]